MAKESFGSVVRRRLLGLGYIATIIGLVALSVAVYNKAFTKVVLVTLRTDHTGNQLLVESDVKERGIIVGSVRKVKSDGADAIVTLAIEPGRADIIPSNVTARILPKTLFGEQYVSLQLPDQPSTSKIRNGDTIHQDRSAAALEAQKVLGDLLPLLQAVKPAELNATLTAVATALRGRGEQLGHALVTLDSYLKQFNPSVPGLVEDLHKLGQVALEYNNAAPDIVETLNNLQTSSKTLVEKQTDLSTLLTRATDTSGLLKSFLADNEQRLITVTGQTQIVYGLLAEYAPEYGCLMQGMNKLHDRLVLGTAGNQIHLSAQIYTSPPGLGKYVPGEQPRLITGFGPNCFGLPDHPIKAVPGPYRCANDGAALTNDKCNAKPNGEDQQAIGSPAETAMIDSLIASTYGTTPDRVPPIASVLAAPALRGAEVNVK